MMQCENLLISNNMLVFLASYLSQNNIYVNSKNFGFNNQQQLN
jgi:uncharacterized protein (UPF0276 family)